jgi:hypothetical protein
MQRDEHEPRRLRQSLGRSQHLGGGADLGAAERLERMAGDRAGGGGDGRVLDGGHAGAPCGVSVESPISVTSN